MADDLEQTIRENAQGDSGRVRQHSLTDQIAADRYRVRHWRHSHSPGSKSWNRQGISALLLSSIPRISDIS